MPRKSSASGCETGASGLEVRGERDKVQRQLNRTTVQIDRYVTAIGESDQRVKGLVDKINVLETERIALEGRLALIDAEAGGAENVVSLHCRP